jgi:hypothetical protein
VETMEILPFLPRRRIVRTQKGYSYEYLRLDRARRSKIFTPNLIS